MVVSPPKKHSDRETRHTKPSPGRKDDVSGDEGRNFMSPSPITTGAPDNHSKSNGVASNNGQKSEDVEIPGSEKKTEDSESSEKNIQMLTMALIYNVQSQRLDFSAFVSKKPKHKAQVNYEKILQGMMEGRDVFMNVLTERLRKHAC